MGTRLFSLRPTPLMLAVVASILATTMATASAAAAEASPALPFQAHYHGMFKETLPPPGASTSTLTFAGTGVALIVGASTIAGQSTLQADPSKPGCSNIVKDHVTLMAANGDEVFVQDTAEDCFVPPNTITGTGTYTITGGTGRFNGATGTGTVSVTAQVTSIVGNVASGMFDPIAFGGTISLPAH